MDSFVSCSYDDAREKIKTVLILGCVSVAVSPLCLLLRLPTGKLENACLITYYVLYVLLCLGIAVPLFIFTIQLLDSKTSKKPMDYGPLKKGMFNSLAQNFTSDEITRGNTMSDRWNKFFIKYDCCAVNQVLGTTNDFDKTPWCTISGSCQQTNSQIPKTCCKDVTEEDYVNATSSCHATVSAGSYKDLASFLHVLVLIFISIFKRSECCTKCCN
ncbi:uncharacterized protein LOC133189406 isoform X2 [Saccostrea echinata]|uniref:uncharacterized protein LOC133189406 isoform X2 n=1 Tax=Saccostrea echinata TaxID=191078 RepID=UPI002A810838|nr:uncharacterized protein LOC133189406 isoform X2 [Saccostrea echinata]